MFACGSEHGSLLVGPSSHMMPSIFTMDAVSSEDAELHSCASKLGATSSSDPTEAGTSKLSSSASPLTHSLEALDPNLLQITCRSAMTTSHSFTAYLVFATAHEICHVSDVNNLSKLQNLINLLP